MTVENRKTVKEEDARTVMAGLTSLAHRPRPNLYCEYTEIPVERFLGNNVLLGFPGVDPYGVKRPEYLWVFVVRLAKEHEHGDELVGVVDSVPFLKMEYEYGDLISFRREEIHEDRIPDCDCAAEVKN